MNLRYFAAVAICLLSGLMVYGVYGPDSEHLNEEVTFTNFSDSYSIGTSGQYGWTIKTASLSGGSGGWHFRCSHTDSGTTHSVCGNSTYAVGSRSLPGGSSIDLFSASISGTIIPPGSGGNRTYHYSVTGKFKGVVSITPQTKTVPLGGGGSSYRLWSTYDGVAHHIYGYWRTMPNYSGDGGSSDMSWHGTSYYGGDASRPGVFAIQGAAHNDGGDEASASELKVIAVSSIAATPTSGTSETSSTDGWERNDREELVKDGNGNNIPEEIPYAYSKKGCSVNLTATPKPNSSWPTFTSGEDTFSYPTWSVAGVSSPLSVLSATSGANSSIIADGASGTRQVVASCGNNKKINVKFIKVEFSKHNLYMSWNFHSTCQVNNYLTADSYDREHFSWSVSGDAELILWKGDGTTVYASSVSPAAEKNKAASEKLSFSGYIRFTKPCLGASAASAVTVTATSEELSSETDSLTILPQYINLTVAGADEETYEEILGVTCLTNPNTNEGSIGAFVQINDNDSNDDKNVDRNKDTDGSDSEPDLLAVTISRIINGPISESHPVTLSIGGYYGYGSSIKVWKDSARSELLLNGQGSIAFISSSAVPGTVYVEATGTTAAALSASYSYSDSTTEADNVYAISSSDSVRLNGFNVDVTVAGIANETNVNDAQNTLVRVLPYELFPGGELAVNPAIDTTLSNEQTAFAAGTLTTVTLSGANLIRALTVADGQTNADLSRAVTFSCASDKVKLYEPIYAADGTTQAVDANNVPLYKEFTGSGLTVADLPKTIYLLPVKDSASKRDIELKLSYACPQNEATHEDVVKLTNLLLDLDTDSNGNGTVEVDSYEEDSTEENASIVVNEGDKDGDGIPDNVDFYISGNGFNTPIFKEIKLRLPHSIKLDNCKIKLK